MKKQLLFIAFLFIILFSCNSGRKENYIWIGRDGNLIVFSGDSCFIPYFGCFVKLYGDSINIKDDVVTREFKLKQTGDSLILSEKDSTGSHFSRSFYKLNQIESKPSSFRNLSYYTNRATWPESQWNSINIDSLGNFQFHKNTTRWNKNFSKDTFDNVDGVIPPRFVGVLNNLLEKCEWKKYYQKKAQWYEGSINSFSIAFPNGEKFTYFDYEEPCPEELRNVFNYIRCLSNLVDNCYFEKKQSLTPHYYDAELTACYNQLDSIRYMRQFDSINYRFPEYPDGMDQIQAIVQQNIHQELGKRTSDEVRFVVDYVIEKDGSIHMVNPQMEDHPFDPNTQVLFSNDLVQAFSKLNRCQPAIFNGKNFAVHDVLQVYYRSHN